MQENKTKQQTTYLSSPVCCLQLKLLNGAAVWGSDPHCPPALVVMLREWLSSSGHGLCVPLKGSESVNTTSALPSSFTPSQFTVFGVLACVVWCAAGYQTLLAANKQVPSSCAVHVLGGGRMFSARKQQVSTGRKAKCAASRSLVMGKEQKSLKVKNFGSREGNVHS